MGSAIGSWPFLLGQMAQVEMNGKPSSPQFTVLTIAVFGTIGMIMIVGLPIVLGIRSENRKREMEHLERMRSIEMGRPIPGEAGKWTPARMAIAMGICVPIGVFGISWLAAESSEAAAPFIWPSAAAVSVASVICSTVLAARIPATGPAPAESHSKPYVDPDTYDAVEHQHS